MENALTLPAGRLKSVYQNQNAGYLPTAMERAHRVRKAAGSHAR